MSLQADNVCNLMLHSGTFWPFMTQSLADEVKHPSAYLSRPKASLISGNTVSLAAPYILRHFLLRPSGYPNKYNTMRFIITACLVAMATAINAIDNPGPGTCDPGDPQICMREGMDYTCGPYGVSESLPSARRNIRLTISQGSCLTDVGHLNSEYIPRIDIFYSAGSTINLVLSVAEVVYG